MTKFDDLLKKAREAGMIAFENGKPASSNPYCRGTDEQFYDEWADGWGYAHFMEMCD